MRIDLITLFPEFFESPLRTGLVGKAIISGVADVSMIDLRTFTSDVHRTVDDTPTGGGGGMVMKIEPLDAAIQVARRNGDGPVVLLTPQGRRLEQSDFLRWANKGHIALIAGRYEGFDDRVRARVDEEISLGDFVLTGGEYAALAIVDGVVRLLPGTLGNQTSSAHDSFSAGLLEHPQFTRPHSFEGVDVPDVLTSGHHENIDRWRHRSSLLRTLERRPDLLARLGLNDDDRSILDAAPLRDVAIAVRGAQREDLGSLLALAAAYGLSKVFLVDGPDTGAVEDLEVTLPDQRPRRKRRGRPPSAIFAAADVFVAVPNWAAIQRPLYGSTRRTPGALDPVRIPRGEPICVAFGDGLEDNDVVGWLPAIRQRRLANRLPLIGAVAAQLERLLTEG